MREACPYHAIGSQYSHLKRRNVHGAAPPSTVAAGLAEDLRCYTLQVGPLGNDMAMSSMRHIQIVLALQSAGQTSCHCLLTNRGMNKARNMPGGKMIAHRLLEGPNQLHRRQQTAR